MRVRGQERGDLSRGAWTRGCVPPGSAERRNPTERMRNHERYDDQREAKEPGGGRHQPVRTQVPAWTGRLRVLGREQEEKKNT
eukprot:scaffold86_cov338-Pavlova_lutheri.AAC.45